jgi:hypothetical protein
VPVGVELTNLSRRMAGKVDSELGRKIYPQRFAVAEPVFANIRTHKRLDRFTLRGKVKVNIQWLLYCMVHNIEKITNYGSASAKIRRKITLNGKITFKKKTVRRSHPQKPF